MPAAKLQRRSQKRSDPRITIIIFSVSLLLIWMAPLALMATVNSYADTAYTKTIRTIHERDSRLCEDLTHEYRDNCYRTFIQYTINKNECAQLPDGLVTQCTAQADEIRYSIVQTKNVTPNPMYSWNFSNTAKPIAYSFTGVDTNGNGLSEYIIESTQWEVYRAGEYQFSSGVQYHPLNVTPGNITVNSTYPTQQPIMPTAPWARSFTMMGFEVYSMQYSLRAREIDETPNIIGELEAPIERPIKRNLPIPAVLLFDASVIIGALAVFFWNIRKMPAKTYLNEVIGANHIRKIIAGFYGLVLAAMLYVTLTGKFNNFAYQKSNLWIKSVSYSIAGFLLICIVALLIHAHVRNAKKESITAFILSNAGAWIACFLLVITTVRGDWGAIFELIGLFFVGTSQMALVAIFAGLCYADIPVRWFFKRTKK